MGLQSQPTEGAALRKSSPLCKDEWGQKRPCWLVCNPAAVVFSPDGRSLVMGLSDTTILNWMLSEPFPVLDGGK
jgi:hypothetical protein